MQIDAGLDTGDMLLKASTRIEPDEDAVRLGERLARMGAALLVETLDGLGQGSIAPEKQDNALATYAPILKKEDGRIDWTLAANAITNMIRGLQPWPGAYTTFRGRLLHLWTAQHSELEWPGQPGELRFNRDGLFAASGDRRWVKLMEVQMEGRRRMTAEDFARGQRVAEWEGLGS